MYTWCESHETFVALVFVFQTFEEDDKMEPNLRKYFKTHE